MKLRQQCSTGKFSRSCVAPLIWHVTPQSPSLSVLWRLPSSAAPAQSSCSPRLAGENSGSPPPVNLPLKALSHHILRGPRYEQRNWCSTVFLYASASAPSVKQAHPWGVPAFTALTICALPLTFWDLNPDILQVNFNSLFIPLHLGVHPVSTWYKGHTTVSWRDFVMIMT